MRFTEFIQANHESIIGEWVVFARTLLPWADGMSESGLRDHAEELLTAVVNDMQSPQTASEQCEKSKGKSSDGILAKIGEKHASDRLETGLSLDQLVSEFRALRASVLRQWERAQGDDQNEITRFNEAIDETLTKSTARYSQCVNATREQFLGILGHDLRNPIGAILMGASLLADSEDPESVEIATSILNSGNRMSRMVSDLLDLTRTRLGAGIPVTLGASNLLKVCEEVIGELKAMHPKAEILLESRGRLDGNWDVDRLAQAISNLIGNALQYGELNKPIRVLAEAKGDEVSVHVHNKGPAIPPTALKTIFAPMARHMAGAHRLNSNVTGLGLGLYIAGEIVTSHKGVVEVVSDEGEGTTFTIRLHRDPSSVSAPGYGKKVK